MKNYYQPLTLNPETFRGQFILTKNYDLIPEGWRRYEQGPWHLGVFGLPVISVENGFGQKTGWCIGYPINDQEPWAEKIIIQSQDKECIDMSAVEEFYEHTGGKYILALLQEHEKKLFLDPHGSLGAVFTTTEPTVASTPTIIARTTDWDNKLIKALNMPESGLWFPSGLTPRKGVKRLLPNHCLNLNDWSINRHWPKCSSDLDVEDDVQKSVFTIISCIKKTFELIQKRYPIQLSLTAGRDTRMLLACVREFLEDIVFFTFVEKKETVDKHIASKISKRFGLNHTFLTIQHASEEEMLCFLYITGHSVGGPIWKIHKTLEGLNRRRVLLPGVAGGVGRGFYWRPNDSEDTMLSAKELLLRCNLPCHNRLLAETKNWLSELSEFNAFNILDLYHIEQRLGCWAAPQHYGNTTSLFEISPFNHRKIFRSMLKLPYEYRRRRELVNDIFRILWPALLELPFNDFTGFRNYAYKSKDLASRFLKRL